MSEQDPRKGAEEAMRQSFAAARRKDQAAAERWSKVAERLAVSAEKLGALPPLPGSVEEEEALQAELLRRLARFVEADREIQIWEAEYEIWKKADAAAAKSGAARVPMRPHPCGPMAEEDYLKHIICGPEPEDGAV